MYVPEIKDILAQYTPRQRKLYMTEWLKSTELFLPELQEETPEMLSELVSKLEPEIRLAGLNPEERLEGLTTDQLWESLTFEQRLELMKKMQSEQADDSPHQA